MKVSTVFVALLAATSLLLPVAAGQGEKSDPTKLPVAAGERALEEGRAVEAAHHFREALVHRPDDAALLERLLKAAQRNDDARAFWAHRWYLASIDERGRAKVSGDLRDLLPEDDAWPSELAKLRVQAFDELARTLKAREKKARRSAPDRLVTWWLRRQMLALAADVPALRAQTEGLAPVVDAPPRAYEPVLEALERTMQSALSNRRTGEAMRAARCLRGLAAQAGFKDLKGPQPRGVEKYGEAGSAGLARAREQLVERVGEPWTVEQLERFTPEQADAFTRAHSSFANPGVAVSPTGKYRIETDCGYETLLGVARTVEDHHARLAQWFGRDPFEGVQGIVRVVPEANGLEAEGAPYWWAGGFQSGHVTTARFSCSTIEAFGHLLTHELTHRFDGALYPGQPAWLVEGKAVWTGSAFGHSTDEEFVENYANFGTIEAAWIKGYGRRDNLVKLIEGTIEEYRDNYVAGFALYVYLTTGESGGRKLFADAFREYVAGSANNLRNPMAWFERHFCDGEAGRPDSLEAFAAGFDEFLRGFYWLDRADWTDRYTHDVQSRGSGWVYDEPTWVWSRKRAEPTFGQDQARVAGDILLDAGHEEDAAEAWIWALACDGRSPRVEARLARVLEDLRKKDAAWVLDAALAAPHGRAPEPAPFVTALARLAAYKDGLAEAAAAYGAAGLTTTAAALAADHQRLARELGEAPDAPGPVADVDDLRALDPPAHVAGAAGWVEDDLVDFEEYRVQGLWFVEDDGDVHVGRRRPRQGTGEMDRNAHRNHAFVRADEWLMPGTYRLTTQVQLTTSFVRAAVVLGFDRRDRHLRMELSGGDFMYAIGQKDEEPVLDKIGWHLHGLRDRDGALPGSTPGGSHEFERPRATFSLELLVDGSAVHASIDGEYLGTYHTVDGAPIEGYVGFATSYGALRFARPTVQRLDRSRACGRAEARTLSLDVERLEGDVFGSLVNNTCRGIDPPTNGALLLWVAAPDLADDEEFEDKPVLKRARRLVAAIERLLDQTGLPQPYALVLPALLSDEAQGELRSELAENPRFLGFLEHPLDGKMPPDAEDTPDRSKRWLIFLDPRGTVRVLEPFFGFEKEFSPTLSHWLTVFRDNGVPERELPPVPRPATDAEERDE